MKYFVIVFFLLIQKISSNLIKQSHNQNNSFEFLDNSLLYYGNELNQANNYFKYPIDANLSSIGNQIIQNCLILGDSIRLEFYFCLLKDILLISDYTIGYNAYNLDCKYEILSYYYIYNKNNNSKKENIQYIFNMKQSSNCFTQILSQNISGGCGFNIYAIDQFRNVLSCNSIDFYDNNYQIICGYQYLREYKLFSHLKNEIYININLTIVVETQVYESYREKVHTIEPFLL